MRLLNEKDIPLLVQWELERPYPWTTPNFMATLSSSTTRTFVWEDAGEVVGFAVVQCIEMEAYLQNIFVGTAHRRKGLGQMMMQKVMIWAKEQGSTELLLDVEAANTAALGLYQKNKFEVLVRRKNSYPHGEDAVVMRCAL